MTGDPRDLRVVEGADTNLIVRAPNAERRRDTANVFGLETATAEQDHHHEPAPPPSAHALPSPAPVKNARASLRCSTPSTRGSSQASRARETFACAPSACPPLRAWSPQSAGGDAETPAWGGARSAPSSSPRLSYSRGSRRLVDLPTMA